VHVTEAAQIELSNGGIHPAKSHKWLAIQDVSSGVTPKPGRWYTRRKCPRRPMRSGHA